MTLYRLDIHEGHELRPICDWAGPVLIRNRRRADARARQEAAEAGLPVVLYRISAAGYLRPMTKTYPDGRSVRLI